MTEIWKPVPYYEERYKVSNLGRVHSVYKQKILTPQMNNSGYFIVHLYSGHKNRKIHLVHRLVAISFLLQSGQKPHVNHTDGCKTNNAAWNLEWVTRSGNMRHAFEMGLAKAPKTPVIGTHLTTGEKIYFTSQTEAEITLAGKNTSAIHHCLNGKNKSAYGHAWELV